MTMRPHVDAALERNIREALDEADVDADPRQIEIIRRELQRTLRTIEPTTYDAALGSLCWGLVE